MSKATTEAERQQRRDRVLRAVCNAREPVTVAEIAESTGMTVNMIGPAVRLLKDSGRIEDAGSRSCTTVGGHSRRRALYRIAQSAGHPRTDQRKKRFCLGCSREIFSPASQRMCDACRRSVDSVSAQMEGA